MRRFVSNRWWAFVLTLAVLLSSGMAIPSAPFADGTPNSDPLVIDDGGNLGGGSPAGDPDGPAGPTKRQPASGSIRPGMSYRVSTAGDGGTGWSVWSWRLHVVLQSLFSRYFR